MPVTYFSPGHLCSVCRLAVTVLSHAVIAGNNVRNSVGTSHLDTALWPVCRRALGGSQSSQYQRWPGGTGCDIAGDCRTGQYRESWKR